MALVYDEAYEEFMGFYGFRDKYSSKSFIGTIVKRGERENPASHALRRYMRNLGLLAEFEFYVHWKEQKYERKT